MFIYGRSIGGFLIALTLVISGGCKGGTPQDGGDPTTMDADAANSAQLSGNVELEALMTQVALQKRKLAALRKQLDQANKENNDLNQKMRTAGAPGAEGERVHELRTQLEKTRAANRRLTGLDKRLNLAQRENEARASRQLRANPWWVLPCLPREPPIFGSGRSTPYNARVCLVSPERSISSGAAVCMRNANS